MFLQCENPSAFCCRLILFGKETCMPMAQGTIPVLLSCDDVAGPSDREAAMFVPLLGRSQTVPNAEHWAVKKVAQVATESITIMDDRAGVLDAAQLPMAFAESAKRHHVGAWRRIVSNLAQTGCHPSISKVAAHAAEPDKRSNLEGWMHPKATSSRLQAASEAIGSVCVICRALLAQQGTVRNRRQHGTPNGNTFGRFVCFNTMPSPDFPMKMTSVSAEDPEFLLDS